MIFRYWCTDTHTWLFTNIITSCTKAGGQNWGEILSNIHTSKYVYVQLANQQHFFIGFFIINFITGGEKGERGIFQDLWIGNKRIDKDCWEFLHWRYIELFLLVLVHFHTLGLKYIDRTVRLTTKAVNREDKRSRRYRDRDFAKFERSRRYRDRYRC